MKLLNKVALITGAATGIGNAIAHKFAAEGARIVILDLEQDACNEAARAITSASSMEALGIQTTSQTRPRWNPLSTQRCRNLARSTFS